jgi:hypothetical protein
MGRPAKSVEDVWYNYMFYPFEQSKAYEELRHKSIKRRFR